MNKKSILPLLFISSFLLLSSCGNEEPHVIRHNSSNSSVDYSSYLDSTSGSSFSLNENIKHIQVISDEVGIYATNIYLSDKISPKGDLEFVYKGAKNTPQEDDVVATCLLNYWTEPTGYEIRVYYNGDTYQNYHKQAKIEFVLEFGASVRAGDVSIYYTPDGGAKELIFYTDAACFYHN